jgi:hypothetical protein
MVINGRAITAATAPTNSAHPGDAGKRRRTHAARQDLPIL